MWPGGPASWLLRIPDCQHPGQHIGKRHMKETTPLIPLGYFLFMAVIITAESVIATVVLVFLPTVQQQTLEHSSAALKKSYRGYCEPDDYSMDWNLVMEKLKCCGVKNYTDFSGSSFEMRTGYAYPRSCCKPIGAADAIYQELPGILATLLLFAELG
ncbi:tetraspanin 16 [Phyllostomus discolor]|uniref:Tetraspanin 16 n=1 Tax=Phyllostomus discolor TaxID=89673 RepID=A0A834DVR0_9CHIR|nr:tetraspanin 16 [Phyllostomus discolor]